jgi:hypothetical protein
LVRAAPSFSAGQLGSVDVAVREGAKAFESSPGDPVMLYNAACMYAHFGEASRGS